MLRFAGWGKIGCAFLLFFLTFSFYRDLSALYQSADIRSFCTTIEHSADTIEAIGKNYQTIDEELFPRITESLKGARSFMASLAGPALLIHTVSCWRAPVVKKYPFGAFQESAFEFCYHVRPQTEKTLATAIPAFENFQQTSSKEIRKSFPEICASMRMAARIVKQQEFLNRKIAKYVLCFGLIISFFLLQSGLRDLKNRKKE